MAYMLDASLARLDKSSDLYDPFYFIDNAIQGPYNEYCDVGELIAKGGFGRVYVVLNDDKTSGYAIKRQKSKHASDTEYIILSYLAKQMILTDRPFPAILGYETCNSNNSEYQYAIVEEYIDGFKLDSKLLKYEELHTISIVLWETLKLIYSYGFVAHNDLHLGNVIINKANNKDRRLGHHWFYKFYSNDDKTIKYKYNIFIIDFGLSFVNSNQDSHFSQNIIADMLALLVDYYYKVHKLGFKDTLALSLVRQGYKGEDVISCGTKDYLSDFSNMAEIETADMTGERNNPQFMKCVDIFIKYYSTWIHYCNKGTFSDDLYVNIGELCDFIKVATDYVLKNKPSLEEDLINPSGLILSYIIREAPNSPDISNKIFSRRVFSSFINDL